MPTNTGGARGPACPASPRCDIMQIVYTSLTVSANVKSKSEGIVKKEILRSVSGIVQPARLTAVMGASGAGKTTLLNVLAGYRATGTAVQGTISVNGVEVTGERMRQLSGYVHQEDVIMDTMTVREALNFAAYLRLPGSVSSQAKLQRALDVADMLNLTKALDSKVGSSLVKGISGGEKRRLSLGMEMITNPSILFLDEPTSGLDTYTAHKVMRILSSLARDHGRTVCATIHQPSSDIFHLFDDMVVLAEGQMLYQGNAEASVQYFASLGYVCPTYTNPADFLFMNILNINRQQQGEELTAPSGERETNDKTVQLAPAGDEVDKSAASAHAMRLQEEERVRGLIKAWEESSANSEVKDAMQHQAITSGIKPTAERSMAPVLTQFRLLAARAFRNMYRNKFILPVKVAQTFVLALIVSLIYLDIPIDLFGVQDRQGSLFFVVVQAFLGSVFGVVNVFGGEKVVFLREFSTRMYSLPPYFLSRCLVQLPISIVLPFCSGTIIYWLVGYQAVVEKYLVMALMLILLDISAINFGIMVTCFSNNLEVTVAMLPLFTMPLLVFSGFIANTAHIPVWLAWIKFISPMFYGYTAVIQNEFSGLVFKCKPNQKCPANYRGEDVIKVMSLDDHGGVAVNGVVLASLAVGFLTLAYCALWFNVRKMVRK